MDGTYGMVGKPLPLLAAFHQGKSCGLCEERKTCALSMALRRLFPHVHSFETPSS